MLPSALKEHKFNDYKILYNFLIAKFQTTLGNRYQNLCQRSKTTINLSKSFEAANRSNVVISLPLAEDDRKQ